MSFTITTDILRDFKIEGVDRFIRDYSAISILEKVKSQTVVFMDSMVSPLRPFGFRGYFINGADYHSSPDGLKNPVLCIGKGQREGYVEKELIKVHKEWIDCWKVIIPRANNIGTELSDDNLNTILAAPNTICTESYLVIGALNNLSKKQCENICSYLKTKFARFMHKMAKSSQDATSRTFIFVPLLDLDKTWSADELYAKYGLTSEEVTYIETSIKPMASSE